MKVATAEVSTLQALLATERQSSTSNPMIERELVLLRHLHDRLREIAKDLGFNAARFLRINAQDDLILHIGFGRLCEAVSDRLGHV